MYTGIYKIADVAMEITSVYKEVHQLCTAYQFDGKPEVRIITTQEDISRETIPDIPRGVVVSSSYLETLAVYRKISEKMLKRNTLLFHGSAVAVDGQSYLFIAPSGTGKSTHTRLWRELLGNRAVMVNDDKPLLQIRENGIFVCGTPWDGKHHLSTNVILPLKAICILERGSKNTIDEISVREVLPKLIQQSYQPAVKANYPTYFTLLDRLGKQLHFYRMHCTISREAAELSYGVMSGSDVQRNE